MLTCDIGARAILICLPSSGCNIIGEFGYVKRQLSSNTYLSGLLSHNYRLRLNFGVLTLVKGTEMRHFSDYFFLLVW